MNSKIKRRRIHMLFLGGTFLLLLGSCASPESGTADNMNISYRPSSDIPHSDAVTEPPRPAPKESEEPLPPISEKSSKVPPYPKESEEPPSIPKESGVPEETLPIEDWENPALSAEESYKAILLGEADFIKSNEDGECLGMVNIKEIWKAFGTTERPSAKVRKFAIVDMDGDGEKEVILLNYNGSIDEGYEILHYQEGKVYGYHFYYRGFLDLKEDGTFEQSGSAFDSAICHLLFMEKGYTEDMLYRKLHRDSDGLMTMEYYANGEICSEEEFNEAYNRQREKPDAVWYDLTPENINLAFENRF